jgi:hypothetical protein
MRRTSRGPVGTSRAPVGNDFDGFPTGALAGPSACRLFAPRATGGGGPPSSGDFTVIDAPPLPSSQDQCTTRGWRQFGFKNQGQCIAFVNRGTKAVALV